MNNIPVHVAIIMDGNGRWAKSKGLPVSIGHSNGAERIEDALKFGKKVGIKYITFYAFSTENWKRDKEEVDHIVKLLFKFYESKVNSLIENDIKFKFVGSKVNLPKNILDLFEKLEKETSHCNSITLNLAFNYGGRLEIVEACNDLIKEGKKEITEVDIQNNLYTSDQPDVDLMIRTSGEQRLSNFLIWQNSYSEFVFVDCFWPDFKEDQFNEAVLEYQNRSRRFGGR